VTDSPAVHSEHAAHPAMIEIQGLTKKYGQTTAVEDISLTVETGEIFGFVGPNGAGKTTTIRMIATLLQPTKGIIRVGGHSVGQAPRQVRRLIGYMPDFFGVYNDMKVWEYLDFFGACYQLQPGERAQLVKDLLELVDLSHRREDMVDKLSRGMKQRLSLARTLIHDPQVLILDEPASGLDPRARVEIRELLLQLSRMGKTIFFSSHILSDVAEICSRVAIIEAGKLVAVGNLEALQRELMPHRNVEITLLDRLGEAQMLLKTLPGVVSVQETTSQSGQPRLMVEYVGDDAGLSRILAALVSGDIPVLRFSEDSRDLEEVFLRVTKGLVT
jgi:ABC-2 type transport system ATP-binding protein